MATAIEVKRVGREHAHVLVVVVLVVMLGGYVYLGYRGDSAKNEIIKEVTAEREQRLAEVQQEVRTEQKRQDEHTASIAVAADQRAAVAEKKAEVAKVKAAAVEKRTETIEKKQKIVEHVLKPVLENPDLLPLVVPTAPAQSTEPSGLLQLFLPKAR